MTNPRKGTAKRTFAAPAGTILEPETTYTIVLSSDGADADSTVEYKSADKDGADDGGADEPETSRRWRRSWPDRALGTSLVRPSMWTAGW